MAMLFLSALSPHLALAAATDCQTYLYFITPNGDQTTYGPVQPGTAVKMEAKVEICPNNMDRWWRVTETKDGKSVSPDPIEVSKIDDQTFDYQPFSPDLSQEGTYTFYLDYSEAGAQDSDLKGHSKNTVSITVSKTAAADAALGNGAKSANLDFSNRNVTAPNYDAYTKSLDPLINASSIPDLVASLIKRFLQGVAAITVIIILVGAFRMVMSQGNTEALTAGRKTVTWAVIGLGVALLSYSIVAILQSLLGVQ